MIKNINSDKYKNIFVIGDLHGNFELLMKKLRSVSFNIETDLLISVGDLVDRGPASVSCLNLLSKPWFAAVRGNHEQFIIEYAEATDSFKKNSNARLHLINGGEWFYDLSDYDQSHAYTLVKDLPYIITTTINNELIGFIHADIPAEDWNIIVSNLHKDYVTQQLIWGRTKISNNDNTTIKNIDKIYLGHTILREPKQLGNCYYIDTGAYYYNNLTILKIK